MFPIRSFGRQLGDAADRAGSAGGRNRPEPLEAALVLDFLPGCRDAYAPAATPKGSHGFDLLDASPRVPDERLTTNPVPEIERRLAAIERKLR